MENVQLCFVNTLLIVYLKNFGEIVFTLLGYGSRDTGMISSPIPGGEVSQLQEKRGKEASLAIITPKFLSLYCSICGNDKLYNYS